MMHAGPIGLYCMLWLWHLPTSVPDYMVAYTPGLNDRYDLTPALSDVTITRIRGLFEYKNGDIRLDLQQRETYINHIKH